MPNYYEIPLQATPQKFNISLGNTDYNIFVFWNNFANCWNFDISDNNDVLIVGSIPLVTGVNLFLPYTNLGFNGQLIVATDHDLSAAPTFDNLGITSHVYWVTQ